MRTCFAFVIAAAAAGFAAVPASATEFTPIGKHGVSRVYQACNDAGGQFNMANDGSYGCKKENCDGKGGDCVVACSPNQNCYGSTPGRVTPPPGTYELVRILKFSPALPPRAGLLEPGQGGSPNGPSGMGTPTPRAPSAPVLR